MELLTGVNTSQKLLDAQSHIWNQIFNFINSMSLKCTIQLGIPDIIHRHGRPVRLSELTDALSINEAKSLCIERLMRLMIHSKFFTKAKISEEDDQEGYWLTPSSYLLCRDEPLSVAPLVHSMLDPFLIDPWHNLSKWFGTNDATPFVTTYGRPIWEQAEHDTKFNAFFNEAMASDARLVSSIITKEYRPVFEGLSSLVDVGGGTGTMAKAMVDAFPGLECTVLDLPHVVTDLEASKELTYVAGDMFESIPTADAVFMKWILHDWPDEACLRILENCRKAIPSKEKGGKVIILDIVVDEDKVSGDEEVMESKLFLDMLMMSLLSGRERTEKEWASLFVAAGFSSYKIANVLGLRSLIEVFP